MYALKTNILTCSGTSDSVCVTTDRKWYILQLLSTPGPRVLSLYFKICSQGPRFCVRCPY